MLRKYDPKHPKHLKPRFTRRKTPNNKKNPTKYDKIVIGLVHANGWCGHCQTLEPIWREMKTHIYKNPMYKNKFIVREFDESNNSDKSKNVLLMKKLHPELPSKISGFPTIFRIKNNVLEIYDKERQIQNMIDWFFNKNDGNLIRHIEVEEENNNFFGLPNLFKGGFIPEKETPKTRSSKSKRRSQYKKVK
jgi:hypothetical protein